MENRLVNLISDFPAIHSRVLAPAPWFPSSSSRFGRYAAFARVPGFETRRTLRIIHPRYPVIPNVGESLAPALLYRFSLSALKRLRQEQDFDLIDAHYFYPDGVAATWLARFFRKPVVITARGSDVSLIARHRIPRKLMQRAAREADGLVAVSQALKDALIDLGIPEGTITVLRNGVELQRFKETGRPETRRELGLSGPVLISVGHLIERKGHHWAIEALPELGEFHLLIAGDGPERNSLRNLAKRLGVEDRVTFLGAVAHSALPRFYSAADALVLASSREGWPNVLLESMACGTPVAASRVWGNPEVVTESQAGVLFEERSGRGVAKAVRRLFGALPSRAQTRAYAERFDWRETSEGQFRLFQRVLELRREGGGIQPR